MQQLRRRQPWASALMVLRVVWFIVATVLVFVFRVVRFVLIALWVMLMVNVVGALIGRPSRS